MINLAIFELQGIIIAAISMSQVSSLSFEAYNQSRKDFERCKVTQLGVEYRGSIAKTVGGSRCQAWDTEEPLHQISTDIKDDNFPERSSKLAKNYCRNPTRDTRGPWCYTMDPTLIDDQCDISLCNFGECRISGAGAEYGGSRKVSVTGKKCKHWDKRYHLLDSKSPKFHDNLFPDESRKKAGSFCRNPTGDPAGPWCYIEQDNYEFVQREYCDVAFCDDKDCLSYTVNSSSYSSLTRLNEISEKNISFWFKLWDPSDEEQGEARILLSLLPIPGPAKKLAQDWSAAVELVFSNSGSRVSFPKLDDDIDEETFESTPDILLGTKWTGIWIAWHEGFISVGQHDSSKPFIMQQYKKKRGISSLFLETFFYYDLAGTGVLWSTDFCQKHCQLHVTFGLEFARIWSMERNNDTYDIRFHARSDRPILLKLHQSPAKKFPFFLIRISKDIVSLEYQESDDSMSRHLKEAASNELLDFWKWKEFSVSIFGRHFRLFAQQTYGNVELLYARNDLFGTLRWFSTGSDRAIAMWTLFCKPEEADAVEEPQPPNCLSDLKDYGYNGSQWTSIGGVPCVPWISDEVPKYEKNGENFPDGSAVKALNRCRNPSRDFNGPYCYAISSSEVFNVTRQYCQIRRCSSYECRMAGTANDYVGTLSITRTGRRCDKWSHREIAETTVQLKKPVSREDRERFNDTLYPEGSARKASNYCRNPTRSIAGTWCYTVDPLVPRDLCNVRDCEKPEEHTFLVRGSGSGRHLYVLPEYRSEGLRFSLKAWEPDQPDSLTFVFMADDDSKSRYILKIGASNNEQIHLYYGSKNSAITLIKKKTLPHLLYLGKWSSFVIQIPRTKILLYYEGAPEPVFQCNYPEPSNAFSPVYYYYGSEKGRTIGVAFDRDSSCHIENTRTNRYTRILPISAWSQIEEPLPEKLVLIMRGKGVITIPLLLFPATPEFFTFILSQPDRSVLFARSDYAKMTVFHRKRVPTFPLTMVTWTNITVRWVENTIEVWSNGSSILRYRHTKPLLFYFFSVGVDTGGWVSWTVNCEPMDIDGPPVDGGWSEWGSWACSVSCNGGTGTRKRVCNSPKPNVRGEPCIGPSTMVGRCNDILCGDITQDTMNLIKRRTRANHTALTSNESDSIVIYCDADIVNSIRTESPRSELRWSLNGLFLQNETERLRIKEDNIVISRTMGNDSGVYAMTLRRVDGSYSIVKIVSLAVIPREEIVAVRETLEMKLICHSAVFSHLYTDLEVFWTINGKKWKDYGVTLPVAVNVEHVRPVNRSHDGLWQCFVRQSDLNFQWNTNAILVKVIGAPNWRTHLMEDQLTRFIFGWLPSEAAVAPFAYFLLLIILASIIVGSFYFIRFRESLKMRPVQRKTDMKDSAMAGYQSLQDES